MSSKLYRTSKETKRGKAEVFKLNRSFDIPTYLLWNSNIYCTQYLEKTKSSIQFMIFRLIFVCTIWAEPKQYRFLFATMQFIFHKLIIFHVVVGFSIITCFMIYFLSEIFNFHPILYESQYNIITV